MSPRSWLAPWKLLFIQNKLITAQARMIEQQNDQLNRIRLDHFREVNALVEGWLIHHDQPEIDMRPELMRFNLDLSDRIAQLEELIV